MFSNYMGRKMQYNEILEWMASILDEDLTELEAVAAAGEMLEPGP